MKNELTIKATNVSPSVNFNLETGLLQIHGNSLPENSAKFYEPVINWIDKYIEAPNVKTEIEFRMVLLNTSSSKMFIDIFRCINKLVERNNSEVNVIWFYENDDEDIQDIGMQYQDFCKAPFKMVGTDFKLIE